MYNKLVEKLPTKPGYYWGMQVETNTVKMVSVLIKGDKSLVCGYKWIKHNDNKCYPEYVEVPLDAFYLWSEDPISPPGNFNYV